MDGCRGLRWRSFVAEGLRVESVVAVLDHKRRLARGGGLDAEVAEHGVGLPATQ